MKDTLNFPFTFAQPLESFLNKCSLESDDSALPKLVAILVGELLSISADPEEQECSRT